MTKEEKVEIFILQVFEPVKDKPGYVWLNKRNFQIISIETLRKALYESLQATDEYMAEKAKGDSNERKTKV